MKPTGENIVVLPPKPAKEVQGIALPENYRKENAKFHYGLIISIGPQVPEEQYTPGKIAVYNPWGAQAISLGGNKGDSPIFGVLATQVYGTFTVEQIQEMGFPVPDVKDAGHFAGFAAEAAV